MRALVIMLVMLSCLLLPGRTPASPLVTIECDAPTGQRFDFGPPPETWFNPTPAVPQLTESRDRYTGVHPVFVIDSTSPNKMTVVWGDTQAGGVTPAPTAATEAAVLLFNTDQITAVEVDPHGVYMHSFFPKLGIGYFASHRHRDLMATTGTYAQSLTARCRFAFK